MHLQAIDHDLEDDYDNPDRIRHAETPELAREALLDSVVLIFKSQVEVAYREQRAGQNALLLLVHLVLEMMEQRLLEAYSDLGAKQHEVMISLPLKRAEGSCLKYKKLVPRPSSVHFQFSWLERGGFT